MKNRKKIFVLATFPPTIGGSPIFLSNLFKQLDKEDYFVLSGIDKKRADYSTKFDCNIYYLENPLKKFIPFKIINKLFIFVYILYGLLLILRHRPGIIMANYPRPDYCIAAYYLSKLTGIPLVTYMHDLWSENISDPFEKKLATRYEPKLMHHSEIIYAITDKAKDFYHNKYKIENIVVLPHSIDPNFGVDYPEEINNEIAKEFLASSKYIKLVFVGAIYKMNSDALHFITKAIHGSKFKLLLCTTTPKKSLIKLGMLNNNVVSTMTNRSDAWSIQKQSDIILIPLSFNSIKHEIETVFPTKVLEHLLAKTPMLSVSPNYSFLHEDIAKHDYSATLTELKADQLLNVLDILTKDKYLKKTLVDNALKYAEMRKATNIINIFTDSMNQLIR